ncbi:pig-H [Schizosaccharomyces japonicus yFS275]|uniref:Pig-H n=1 Tax=Schizosaccharomyces japonicus (strain yFS275 / FY16936) TaxID=402676 RepID=B6K181_SCHJY|nr:pig-H [Schizosaccharomyces japonicus yFS275]EEB07702.1 pig-H [Schizosaccharomyces japonicus yFS275]
MLTIKRYPGATKFTVYTSKCHGTQMFAICFISFGIGVTAMAFETSPRLIVFLAQLIFILSMYEIISGVNHESFLVVKGLGIQTNCHSIVPWKSSSKLIPLSSIREIFINEGFRRYGVVYYMGIIVEHEPMIHVVFPTLLPRKNVLIKVYTEVRKTLDESI